MDWSQLSGLPEIVAVLVVFTTCVVGVIRVLVKYVIRPFQDALRDSQEANKLIIGNHLEHDKEERHDMKRAIETHTNVIAELVQAIRCKFPDD